MLCCHTNNSKAYKMQIDMIFNKNRQIVYNESVTMLIFTEDCTSHSLLDGPSYIKNNLSRFEIVHNHFVQFFISDTL